MTTLNEEVTVSSGVVAPDCTLDITMLANVQYKLLTWLPFLLLNLHLPSVFPTAQPIAKSKTFQHNETFHHLSICLNPYQLVAPSTRLLLLNCKSLTRIFLMLTICKFINWDDSSSCVHCVQSQRTGGKVQSVAHWLGEPVLCVRVSQQTSRQSCSVCQGVTTDI